MATPTGVVGSRLYITSVAAADTVDTLPEWTARNWAEIGMAVDLGEFGRMFDLVTLQEISTGRTHKLKGAHNDGSISFVFGQDLSDAGQAILEDASNDVDQDNYGFRIEFNDAPSGLGGPSTFYFRGLPMSYRTQIGSVNNAIRATAAVEINSQILHEPPAQLYDQFTSGSLDHYFLAEGSDAEATAPVISSGELVAVTGNAGTGYAADGTQAIGLTGYTLSNGDVTIEARLKIGFLTNVAFFFGLTDQNAALEVPIESAASADTITTNATDAVGFMFDTEMTTDNFWLVGVNNNVDETAQDSLIAPVADTYITLRIEITAAGTATFYTGGVLRGVAMTTACRTSVALYPTLVAAARSTSSRTLTTEYLYLRQD